MLMAMCCTPIVKPLQNAIDPIGKGLLLALK